jgi:GNAT superfamily N-acetyltransferase
MGTDAKRERADEARKSRKFGPSKASVQAAPGQTEDQIVAVMRSILGRPRATLRDAASLAGAPDDALVVVGMIPRHGRRAIQIRAANESASLRILLYQRFDWKPILENEQIDVVEGRRGRGTGTALLGRQVEQARRLGIAEIQGYAARNDRIGDVGYLVWPLLGFEGILPRDILDRLPSSLSGARKLSDLFRTVEGRQWWRENGDSIPVVFDLGPRSRAVRWLRAYLRGKGLL